MDRKKEYGEIAVLYDNEIWYKYIYKEGDPKFSYSMLISGESRSGNIDAINLGEAQKQVEQIVLKIYKDMIETKKKSIFECETILDLLS